MSGTRIEFRLPDVGEGLDEAEVVTWLVAEGDMVGRDQPLVEVLTDKAQVELPSPVAGRVVRLAAASGDRVQVGTVLVELEPVDRQPASAAAAASANGDGVAAAVPAPAGVEASGVEASGVQASGVQASGVQASGAAARPDGQPGDGYDPAPGPAPGPGPSPGAKTRPKASPSTRRLAVEMGVDLRSVPGSGPGGRVLADDVRAAAQAPAPQAEMTSPAPARQPAPWPAAITPAPAADPALAPTLGVLPFGVHALRGIRRLTAEAMARSWSEIPHITGMDEVDATALLEARQRLREMAGAGVSHLTPLSLLALAVVSALRRFPLVNASLDTAAGTITVLEHINLGIAVATDAGLVVPVVTDADRRGLSGLAAEMGRLAEAARTHTVSPGELRGGTFTITNYGSLGGRFATPIIRPGEVGIMGFGAIRPRPLVVDGAVEARPTLPVVFSADHRLIDGDVATAFQEHVIARVREPVALLLEA